MCYITYWTLQLLQNHVKSSITLPECMTLTENLPTTIFSVKLMHLCTLFSVSRESVPSDGPQVMPVSTSSPKMVSRKQPCSKGVGELVPHAMPFSTTCNRNWSYRYDCIFGQERIRNSDKKLLQHILSYFQFLDH